MLHVGGVKVTASAHRHALHTPSTSTGGYYDTVTATEQPLPPKYTRVRIHSHTTIVHRHNNNEKATETTAHAGDGRKQAIQRTAPDKHKRRAKHSYVSTRNNEHLKHSKPATRTAAACGVDVKFHAAALVLR